jgi:hypothetical protein
MGQPHSGSRLAEDGPLLRGFYQRSPHLPLGGYPATCAASAHQQESRYKGIDDTIVQLFISQASGLITRVERIQSECSTKNIRRRKMKILMVLIPHDVFANTGRKTSFWLEEFCYAGQDH